MWQMEPAHPELVEPYERDAGEALPLLLTPFDSLRACPVPDTGVSGTQPHLGSSLRRSAGVACGVPDWRMLGYA